MAFRRRNDPLFTIEYAGEGCRELTGYDPADLVGNRGVSFWSIIHPSNMALVETTIRKASRNRSPFQHEYRIITATGRKKWVWEQGWWDLDETGAPVAIEGYISDITPCRNRAGKRLGGPKVFPSMADLTCEGLIILDDRYRLVYVNEEICRIGGHPREDLIGRDFREFLTEESRRLVMDRCPRRKRREPLPGKYEASIVDASGHIRRLLVHSTRQKTLAGRTKIIAQILDITDLRHAEVDSTPDSLRNYLIARKMHDVVWTVDMNLKYTYLSPSVERIFGYKADELLHQDIKITMTPESYDLCITTLNSILQCLAQGGGTGDVDRFRTMEIELVRKDGSHAWAEVKSTFIRDVNRLPVEILGVTRDITTRKKTEKDLKNSRDFLNALVNSLDDPFFVKDGGGCWIVVNDRACELLGRTREEIVGRCDHELFAPEKISHIQRTDSEAITRGRTVMEEETVTLHGEERIMSVKKSPYIDPVSGRSYVTCLMRDITDRKRIETALMESDENLMRTNADLELLVENRTSDLLRANRSLEQEIEVRKRTESELRAREKELEENRKNLEEMNTALRVLLKHRSDDRADIESTVMTNLKSAILPSLERLKSTDLKEKQKECVSLIESQLRQITSPYIWELSSGHLNLSPAEIQVASLIKEGKSSKEIAAVMNVSVNTVLTHRYHIRQKTGLKNSKVNLQSYLRTLE
jgi:PAS domain S-box-containing protein